MLKKIENPNLGHSYFYLEHKVGRLFLASQVLKELGYTGNLKQIGGGLIEGTDFYKFFKKTDSQLFDELSRLNLLGQRASEIIMISESGFWKLVMQSKKPLGIKTRDWLANEVLPSIRKTGSYTVAANNPLADFTERKTQLDLSKSVNGIINQTAVTGYEYAEFWNELHRIVTGMTAKEIKKLYNSKQSAKEVLRTHAPHLEATEAVIEDLWKKGIGLDQIKRSELHLDLKNAFMKIWSFGIDPRSLNK